MSHDKTRHHLLQNDDVRQMIAERAYFLAEQHGFPEGQDHDNWLAAERDTLDHLLSNGNSAGIIAPILTNGSAPLEAIAPAAKPVRKRAATIKTNPTNPETAPAKLEAAEGTTPRQRAPKKKLED